MKKVFLMLSVLVLGGFQTQAAQADGTEPAVAVPYKISGVLGNQFVETAAYLKRMEILNRFFAEVHQAGWKVVKSESRESIITMSYTKKAGEKVESIVLNKTRGCVVFDAACKRYVSNLNRRMDVDLDQYEGEVSLPGAEVRFEVVIDAGDNYQERRDASGAIQATMSKKMETIVHTVDSIAYARIGQICFSECTDLYNLTIEQE